MPPSLTQHSDNNLVTNPEIYYTNEDISILHDIVVHAQELLRNLPEREKVPTNALFHAYYVILPSIGIDVDHDSRYARILFKIGGMRGALTLYEKFESVLSRMGIEIQYDQEDSNAGQEGKSELHTYQDRAPQTFLDSSPGDAGQDTRRRRRNSESSLQDATSGQYHDHRAREKYFSSPSMRYSPHETESSKDINVIPKTSVHVGDQTLFHAGSFDGRERQGKHGSLGAWLSDSLNQDISRKQAMLDSTHGNMRVRRRWLPVNDIDATTASAVPSSVDSSLTFNTLSRSIKANQQNNAISLLSNADTFTPASETLMGIDLALIQQFQHKTLLRQTWLQWQNKALQLLEDNINLEILAKLRDRHILLRQALDSWRMCIEERRQSAGTKRFFEQLEKRASRARDLFLLAKAFTHWTYNASDEVQKTSLARRHILRTRYFKAWRENTAVNNLKSRHQIIRRFFSIWKRQLNGTTFSAEKGVSHFRKNLSQRIFWSWFWAFCQRKAPLWWADTLQRKQLATWVERAEECNELKNLALQKYSYKVSQKICLVWKIKALDYSVQECQASDFRRNSSFQNALDEWRIGVRLLPLLKCHRSKRKRSVQHNILRLWLLRVKQEGQAANFNRLKTMQNAYLMWNDKLRCHALQFRINDRLVLRGLYKWVLSERLILARRLLEQRTMQVSFGKLKKAVQAIINRNARDDNAAQDFAAHRLLLNVTRHWHDSWDLRLQNIKLASSFLGPKSQSGCLARWLSQSKRVQHLQNWARDGNLYFTGNKTLKSWKSAMETVKRKKIRNLYSQFRRWKKVNLATRLVLTWRQQANTIIEAERTAAENRYNRKIVFCSEIFDRWRDRAEEVTELALLQKQFVLRKRLNKMESVLTNQQLLIRTATSFFEDHATIFCIKRWSRIALQLRVRQYWVIELRDKYTKKNLRKVVFHWQQRAIEKQLELDNNIQMLKSTAKPEKQIWSPMKRTGKLSEVDNHESEEWTDGLDEVATVRSFPAYLTTPSRRLPKAKVNAMLPSTTPKAPLSTPAERLLRTQYSAGSLPYFRRTLENNLLGRNSASVILEGALTIEETVDKTVQ